ncbi:MAG: DNA-processing protein DprA [Prevotella sp.]|nr:DNA-processing protein DprA [Prevotella sp.]
MTDTYQEEALYAMALTRLAGLNTAAALHLYRELGSAVNVYAHRNDIADVVPDCTPRLVEVLKNWDEALRRAEEELMFDQRYSVRVLTLNDDAYPARLRECADAPVVLYYRGNAELSQQRVISIVGTRHCTAYGRDLVNRFMTDLRQLCPEMLIISGLAYGIDICSHRAALQQGYETVGVLAHGLDELYPNAHRETAHKMVTQGGLLTEYMTQTRADKMNFVRRNRIVAGISDASILVESAAKGGGLITMHIAQSYDRATFAFPGNVGSSFSEGCNSLIRDNGAALITSAQDFVEAMGWQDDSQRQKVRQQGVERQLFPALSPEEQAVVDLLQNTNDLQQNIIAVKTNISMSQLTALLFSLEMKGVLKPLAGGVYHLLL